jgi:hypothetical protein
MSLVYNEGFDGYLTLERIPVDARAFHGMLYENHGGKGRENDGINENWEMMDFMEG